ncbi:MAG: hypothetical protein ACM336_13280 [Acidobacteriota bacterium]
MDRRSQWSPMRWPGSWRDASLLDLIEGTTINCLVAGGENPALMDRARRLGIDVIGESNLPPMRADAVWPAIPAMNAAEGGPTGAPWVDSNGWYIRLARTRAPGEPVWIPVAPPKETALRAEHYLLAVADAAAYGGRWLIELDPKMEAALAGRDQAAVAQWKSIAKAVRFFDAHREWQSLPPCSALAVISDFAGPNEFIGQELLNLLPRRGATYRIIDKPRAGAAPLDGINGIIYPDVQPPDAALHKKLAAFVENGGVLVASAKYPVPAGEPASDAYRRWNIYAAGKGRLAISKEESPDPYLVASDAQVLVGHRHDVVRYFNFSTLNGYYTASADGRKAVLHAINYAMRPWGHPVSIALATRYAKARMWGLGAAAPEPLELVPAQNGVEVHLPPFDVYAAIELDA